MSNTHFIFFLSNNFGSHRFGLLSAKALFHRIHDCISVVNDDSIQPHYYGVFIFGSSSKYGMMQYISTGCCNARHV